MKQKKAIDIETFVVLAVVIAFGAIVGGIYRIVLFLENKNTKTLHFFTLFNYI